jgi:transposase
VRKHASEATRARASKLWRDGWHEQNIAEELHVSRTTIRRWLSPVDREHDLQTSRDWKAQHAERRKAYDRAYHMEHRVPCPWCATLMDRDSTQCAGCISAIAQARHSIVVGCYADGWSYAEIAVALGTTKGTLSVLINRLRKDGRIGYRRNG